MGLTTKKPGPTVRPHSAHCATQLRQKRWPLMLHVSSCTEYCSQDGQRTAQVEQINCTTPPGPNTLSA
jgi:hypothetical protein